MACGCTDRLNSNNNKRLDNKQLDNNNIGNNINNNKILRLESIQELSIDEIINLYRDGYRLEGQGNNVDIVSLGCTGNPSTDIYYPINSLIVTTTKIYKGTVGACKITPTSRCLDSILFYRSRQYNTSYTLHIEIRENDPATNKPKGTPGNATGLIKEVNTTFDTSLGYNSVTIMAELPTTGVPYWITIRSSDYICGGGTTGQERVELSYATVSGNNMAFYGPVVPCSGWSYPSINDAYALEVFKTTYTLPPVLNSISITPTTASINIGYEQQFSASCLDQYGASITCPTLTWYSSDGRVSINSSGLAIGNGACTSNIYCTGGGKTSNTAVLTVNLVVGSITLSPLSASLIAEATQQLTATCKDLANVNVITCPQLTWYTSNASVATVNSGLVTAGSASGTANITCTGGGRSSAAPSVITVNTLYIITVTSPNGGENWVQNTPHNITWTSSNVTGNVTIELLKAGSLNTTILSSIAANTGTYSWTVPSAQTVGTDYTIKITSVDNSSITDTSNANFQISAPPVVSTITVTSPNGGENWVQNTPHNITWTSSNVTGNVYIDLYKAGFLNAGILPSIAANAGTYTWTVPSAQMVGTDYTIKITSINNTSITDSSNANFQISAPATSTITVTSPNGGENWVQNTPHNITWTSSNVAGNVKIDLLKGGTVNLNISINTANAGTYTWTVPPGQTIGTDYAIKITSINNTSISDMSDSTFGISAPTTSTITVTYPNGGENWLQNTTYNIRWTSSNFTGNVRIDLYKGGTIDNVISSETVNTGIYGWKVPSAQTIGTDYTIKITSANNSSITDTSNAVFSIGTVSSSTDGGGAGMLFGLVGVVALGIMMSSAKAKSAQVSRSNITNN